MREISKAQFETTILEKFLRLIGWVAREVQKTESPDFLITQGDRLVGLEVCKMHHEKEPGTKFSSVQRVSMETKIALNARQHFTQHYKIPLHVDVEFKRNLQLDARAQQLLAQTIAEHIWQEVQHKQLHSHYSVSKDRNLPEELSHLFIYFHPKVNKSIWYSGKAFMLPDLSCKSICQRIAKKEAKIPLYKTKAHSLVLLLVEGFSMESLFDRIEIPDAELQTSFDHVYLLRDIEDSVLQLK